MAPSPAFPSGSCRWQVREAKREDLASMRAKFADDQKKVEKLRSNRRFMPY